jgi:hypothetical protein
VCRATNGARTEFAEDMGGRNKVKLLFKICNFNFCVAITFLPINLCNHLHHF